MRDTNESIENRAITISLRMAWTVVVSLAIGSVSVAGVYFGVIIKFKDVTTEINTNKTFQDGKNQLYDLQLENIKLNAQKQEIDLKEYKRQLDLKKDK